ncbi:hypothetical protein PCC8801_3094 [Rippkaea orientalis PCC 8801]|uniref:Uncharacterized protein n=1 Tax=Rippkaea orientalis (strain PCC 8801 / RF-1) TaxID=41431 RepID=B7JX87_RIPO1|nr:hypothetical protein [Rippkaea orientalis]ACK67075.1 hypothetical protein PCC8801_3094 [Rippkaea orientalis PCC 8801]
MKKTYTTFALMAFFVVGWGTLTASQSVQASSDPFADFMKNDCVPGAQKAGLTKNEAQQGCTCTMNTLRKKYSTPAFRTLLTKYRSGDAKAKQTLRSYGETCFEQVLDDILFED